MAEIHRYTCRRCGQSFVCDRPTSVDSSWNRYALHSYDCEGHGPRGYEADTISTDPFSAVSVQPSWSPHAARSER
jgi:hypothetical protein